MDFRTLCARGAGIVADCGQPLAPPIVTASAHAFADQAAVDAYYSGDGSFIYSRYENPTVVAAERLLATLEGAEDAALFASGMAAISTTLLALLRRGERIVAQRDLYGGTSVFLTRVLPDFDIDVELLGLDEIASLRPEDLRATRVLLLESPTNPCMRLVDLRRASEVARAAGVTSIVDATFATPACLRPIGLGCDLVLHSATKYLGGHGDVTAGACAGSAAIVERVKMRRRSLGGVADAFSAFLVQRGLRTLAVRMAAHGRGAEHLARALESHPKVRRVLWPFLEGHRDHALAREQMLGPPGMLTLELDTDAAGTVRVHDALQLFVRASTLGGVESLVSIPARASHRFLTDDEKSRAGITPSMLRLSVGLESPDDLLADVHAALEQIDPR